MAELNEHLAPRAVPSVPAPSTRPRHAAGLAGAVAVAAVALAVLVLHLANGPAESPRGLDYLPPLLIATVSFGLPGALVLARRVAPAVGAVSTTVGLSFGLTALLTGWAVRAIDREPGSLPAADAAVWLVTWCWIPG